MSTNFSAIIPVASVLIPALISPHHTVTNTIATREPVMTDFIQELVNFLSQDSLTIDDISRRIGPVTDDPGIPMPMQLQSNVVGIASADLSRYPDSGLPYVLTLELLPNVDLTPTTLKTILGDYQRARTDFTMPPQIIFYPSAQGENWEVAVIVQLESIAQGLENARITSIAFRRDPIKP